MYNVQSPNHLDSSSVWRTLYSLLTATSFFWINNRTPDGINVCSAEWLVSAFPIIQPPNPHDIESAVTYTSCSFFPKNTPTKLASWQTGTKVPGITTQVVYNTFCQAIFMLIRKQIKGTHDRWLLILWIRLSMSSHRWRKCVS